MYTRTDKILARRNGAERYFSVAQWESLPKDKYGWERVSAEALPEQGVIKNVTTSTYIPPEVREVQAKKEADAVVDNKPETEANSEANADSKAGANGADDVKANEGADLKEDPAKLTEKQYQLEQVKAMVAEGKDRKAVAAELGIHWQQAQKLIDKVNSEANADNKE